MTDQPDAVRPPSLRAAVGLMYLGAVLQVIAGVILFVVVSRLREDGDVHDAFADELRRAGRDESQVQSLIDGSVSAWRVGIVLGTLVFTALWLLLARTTARGLRWARIAATVLGFLALISSVYTLLGAVNPGSIIVLVLVAAILLLLYRPETSAYFEAASARRG
jgi:hypothetical protein